MMEVLIATAIMFYGPVMFRAARAAAKRRHQLYRA
jgi:hypothetical protein